MAKEDFKKNMVQPTSAAAEAITGEIKKGQSGREHKQAPAEEIARRQSEMTTQGVKGAKLRRINLSVSSDNYDFISTMSKIKGQTMTRYINSILTEYRKKNDTIYQDAKRILEEFK